MGCCDWGRSSRLPLHTCTVVVTFEPRTSTFSATRLHQLSCRWWTSWGKQKGERWRVCACLFEILLQPGWLSLSDKVQVLKHSWLKMDHLPFFAHQQVNQSSRATKQGIINQLSWGPIPGYLQHQLKSSQVRQMEDTFRLLSERLNVSSSSPINRRLSRSSFLGLLIWKNLQAAHEEACFQIKVQTGCLDAAEPLSQPLMALPLWFNRIILCNPNTVLKHVLSHRQKREKSYAGHLQHYWHLTHFQLAKECLVYKTGDYKTQLLFNLRWRGTIQTGDQAL